MSWDELLALRDRLALWALQPNGREYVATVAVLDNVIAMGRALTPDEADALRELRTSLDSIELSMLARHGGCA
jgi:hypothetical protein